MEAKTSSWEVYLPGGRPAGEAILAPNVDHASQQLLALVLADLFPKGSYIIPLRYARS